MTVVATEAAGTSSVFDGLKIIDCDAHFTEPPDLWSSRVTGAYRDRVPVMETRDGVSAWYLEGDLWCGVGGNTIRRGGQKVLGEHVLQPFEEVDPASWDPRERVRLMDQMGVWAQVLYPNAVGFSSNHVFSIEDLGLREAVLTSYNTFYLDIQQESDDRLLGQALLPVWDMDLTVKEMTRLLEGGLRGFTLSDKPHKMGLPELTDAYWEPMWDLFNQSGAVVNFHIGSGASREVPANLRRQRAGTDRLAEFTNSDMYLPEFGPQRRLASLATQFYMSNARIVVLLCMSNLFDRYPNLKILSAESGIGWVPFILEAMEFQLDEMVTDPEEVAMQKLRPIDYFRNHFLVPWWFERIGPRKLIEDVGVNNVVIETDIPHPTCLYPNSRQKLETALVGLDPHVIRRVLQDNAAEAFKIPV